MKFDTKVVHAGQEPDPRTGAVMTPIYATSTYAQSSPGEHQGYDYARTRNPTRDALEACLAALEGGDAAFAFASGMAAIGTVLETLDAGSHVVCMHDLYGGSYRILERVRKRSAGLQASFVDLSGIKTLALRMARHCGNAMHIAAWLEKHPKIERVIYPGLASHPQHLLAAKQMNQRYGGMVSAVLKGGLPASRRFLERCKLFTLAESLGGVESLVEHPAIMTHASLPEDVRAGLGISDALVRLSVGIEDVEDLIAELKHALD